MQVNIPVHHISSDKNTPKNSPEISNTEDRQKTSSKPG